MARSPSASASSSTSSRVSVDDWVQAGFQLLAEEGIQSIKIDRLCRRVGVTKGSFYWHFDDLQAYLEAVAEAWGDARDDVRAEWVEYGDLAPHERLEKMTLSLTNTQHWVLERAVREWARSDAKVAEHVHASDRWVYKGVRQTFMDAGFSPSEASWRARALFFAGIGVIHVGGGPSDARARAEQKRFLELLLRPVDGD